MGDIALGKIPRWTNRRQFLLSCMGYTVGLGNFWRFPWLVKEYGGGAFLIAYVVMFILVGVPVLYLELAVGRLMRTSAIASWERMSKYACGLGFTCAIISFLMGMYYVVIITWCFLYFVSSFQYPLPWSHCPRERVNNVTIINEECDKSDAVAYHFYRRTLNISPSINEGWFLHTNLVIGFTIMWIILILSLYKGIKSAGKINFEICWWSLIQSSFASIRILFNNKSRGVLQNICSVVYFTAIFPYIALVVLLVRGALLDGAVSVGLSHYITPNWAALSEIDVWYNAAAQNLYSMGLSLGVWTTYSSFCPPNQLILSDALYAAFADIGSSILGGVVIFQILGFRATMKSKECFQITNSTLSTCTADYYMEQTQSGHGLAFIAFSEAITHIPGSPLFSVLFFLLLVALGTDSMFGMIEVCVNLVRMTNKMFEKYPMIPLAIICIPNFLLGFLMLTGAGSYVMELIIVYGGDIPIVIVGLLEILVVTVFYGVRRFSSELKTNCNQEVPYFISFCWYFASPLLITAVLCLRLYKYSLEEPILETWDKYTGTKGKMVYPAWAYAVAVTLCVVSLLPIPIGIFYGLYRKKNSGHKYKISKVTTNNENRALVTSL